MPAHIRMACAVAPGPGPPRVRGRRPEGQAADDARRPVQVQARRRPADQPGRQAGRLPGHHRGLRREQDQHRPLGRRDRRQDPAAASYERRQAATATRAGPRTARGSCSSRTAPARRNCTFSTSPPAARPSSSRTSAPGRGTASGRRTDRTSRSCRPCTRSSASMPFAESDKKNKEKDDAAEKSPVKAKVFTKLFFRHWDEYVRDKRQHLFVSHTADYVRGAPLPSRATSPPATGTPTRPATPSPAATTSRSRRTARTSSSPPCRRRTRRGAPNYDLCRVRHRQHVGRSGRR